MISKILVAALFSIALASCTATRVESPDSDSTSSASEREMSFAPPLFMQSEESTFPNTDNLLAYRDRGCALSEPQRLQQLREYRGKTDPASVAAMLMLASCAPDKTPGLLAEALREARKLEGAPASFEGLVNLVGDHARTYLTLEQKRARLQELVEGIREIEDQMKLSEEGNNRD